MISISALLHIALSGFPPSIEPVVFPSLYRVRPFPVLDLLCTRGTVLKACLLDLQPLQFRISNHHTYEYSRLLPARPYHYGSSSKRTLLSLKRTIYLSAVPALYSNLQTHSNSGMHNCFLRHTNYQPHPQPACKVRPLESLFSV